MLEVTPATIPPGVFSSQDIHDREEQPSAHLFDPIVVIPQGHIDKGDSPLCIFMGMMDFMEYDA